MTNEKEIAKAVERFCKGENGKIIKFLNKVRNEIKWIEADYIHGQLIVKVIYCGKRESTSRDREL